MVELCLAFTPQIRGKFNIVKFFLNFNCSDKTLIKGHQSNIENITVSKTNRTLSFGSQLSQNIYDYHYQYSVHKFLRKSTLMASRYLAASLNKSPAWSSFSMVCPGGQTVHANHPHHDSTAQRWTGDERGSLSYRNHSLAIRAIRPTFNFKPQKIKVQPWAMQTEALLWIWEWGVVSFQLGTPLDNFLKSHLWLHTNFLTLRGAPVSKVRKPIYTMYRYAIAIENNALEVVRLLLEMLLSFQLCEGCGSQRKRQYSR